jgi:hypothetical protein
MKQDRGRLATLLIFAIFVAAIFLVLIVSAGIRF